jgi:hypothetical protein
MTAQKAYIGDVTVTQRHEDGILVTHHLLSSVRGLLKVLKQYPAGNAWVEIPRKLADKICVYSTSDGRLAEDGAPICPGQVI